MLSGTVAVCAICGSSAAGRLAVNLPFLLDIEKPDGGRKGSFCLGYMRQGFP
jgi:hypothetical protein